VTSFPVSYPAASFTFRRPAGAGRWLVGMDGKPARAAQGGGTTFTTLSGQPMTFARGPVWVVLAAAP
jgi:hypothetical protein